MCHSADIERWTQLNSGKWLCHHAPPYAPSHSNQRYKWWRFVTPTADFWKPARVCGAIKGVNGPLHSYCCILIERIRLHNAIGDCRSGGDNGKHYNAHFLHSGSWWLYLVIVMDIYTYGVKHDHTWSCLVIYSPFLVCHGHTYSDRIIFDHAWSCMTMYGQYMGMPDYT